MLYPTVCVLSLVVAAAIEKSPYELGRYTEHYAPVTSIVLAPDGEVVSTGDDGKVRRWDVKTLQPRGERPLEPFKIPCQVAISPNGELIAIVGNEDGFYFGVRTYPKASVFNHLEQTELSAVAFSPDGKLLAVGGVGSGATVWDTSTSYNESEGKFRASFDDKKLDLPPNCVADMLAFSHDSSVLVALGSKGPGYTMQMWHPKTGKMFGERPADGPALAFAPDGKTAITGRTIWKFAKGQPPVQLVSFHPLNAAAYAPDSKWLVTGGFDNCLTFWEPLSGKKLAVVRAHDDAITSVAVSKDGKQLISGSRDGTVRIWDVAKMLADKPLEQTLTKLAKKPQAYAAWRLGFCYSTAILGYDPTTAKSAMLDEAEKRAEALGIKLPALPEKTDLSSKVDLLSQHQQELAKQVTAKVGELESKVFEAGLTLPMLRFVVDLNEGVAANFGEQVFPGLSQEVITEFGALPVMFEHMQGNIAGDAGSEDLEKRLGELIREIDLNLEAFANAASQVR